MLQAWLTPLAAWQAQFHDGPQASPALPPMDRLARIAHDLSHPSMPPMPPMPPAVASSEPWPRHASAAYRWGVSYVVEGSQLGGAVLYGRLHARLAPHPLTYLRGDSAGPGARWRAFMLAIRAAVQGEEDVAEACRGACDAFDRILALRPAS